MSDGKTHVISIFEVNFACVLKTIELLLATQVFWKVLQLNNNSLVKEQREREDIGAGQKMAYYNEMPGYCPTIPNCSTSL